MEHQIADELITMRLFNACTVHGIHTVEQLSHWPVKKFKSIRGIGRKTVAEAKDMLSHHGLSFADEAVIVGKELLENEKNGSTWNRGVLPEGIVPVILNEETENIFVVKTRLGYCVPQTEIWKRISNITRSQLEKIKVDNNHLTFHVSGTQAKYILIHEIDRIKSIHQTAVEQMGKLRDAFYDYEVLHPDNTVNEPVEREKEKEEDPTEIIVQQFGFTPKDREMLVDIQETVHELNNRLDIQQGKSKSIMERLNSLGGLFNKMNLVNNSVHSTSNKVHSAILEMDKDVKFVAGFIEEMEKDAEEEKSTEIEIIERAFPATEEDNEPNGIEFVNTKPWWKFWGCDEEEQTTE